MNIGLYFGSFNPVHTGHLIIASHIINATELNEVWFIVSPQNPFKKSSGLLNEHHRLHLIHVALEGEQKLKVSSVEFKLPKPSYTIDTLTYLTEKYPVYNFTIIMGSDGFQNIDKWKNSEAILNEYKILVYKRPGFEVNHHDNNNVKILDAPLLEISSTHIRELIRKGKSIRYLVTDAVMEEIDKNNYYHSSSENPTKG